MRFDLLAAALIHPLILVVILSLNRYFEDEDEQEDDLSMPEMPRAGERHRHPARIRRRDDFHILH